MMAVMELFSQRLDQLAACIDSVSEVDKTSTEVDATTAPQMQTPWPRLWTDRPLDETPDYTPIVRWLDDEEPSGQSLLEVSEATSSLLTSSFSQPLANLARLSLKKSYSMLKVDATECA